MTFAVDHVVCGACVARIERELSGMPGLAAARVNLTQKRLVAQWREESFDPARIAARLDDMGYAAKPFRATDQSGGSGQAIAPMLRYLAVAFFGAMNIMLFSISIWSGNASDITPETRDLFHWVSALIALPVAAYSGQPFYRNAWRALRSGHVNMDVPITLGVALALVLSIYETTQSATHAYFDSAIMLLFFLLGGRTLDAMMREKAKALTANLLALRGQFAQRLSDTGALAQTPVSALAQGDRIVVAQGERIGADGVIESGTGELDVSLITGETKPASVAAGGKVYAGSLNLGSMLIVRVERGGAHDLVEEIERLRDRAMAVKDKRIVLADRAAQYYAPFVHSAAALTFLAWYLASGSLHLSAVTAIAVLIITCPCALGLAIPAVHVAAAAALMRRGILLQEGDALERIAECDTIVFDKTGTLTLPEMRLCNGDHIAPGLLARAQTLALASRHPVALALAAGAKDVSPAEGAKEIPGQGVEASIGGHAARLGNPAFTGVEDMAADALHRFPGATALGYADKDQRAVFLFRQELREDARQVAAALNASGLQCLIFSGDNEQAVASIARELGIQHWRAAMTPAGKIAALDELAAQGRKVMMIGDGINDAPALARAHASLTPASATQIAQASADALFLGDRLAPVAILLGKARLARRLMTQNLWFAVIYNTFAIPIAVAGFATPLLAAAAMSLSSIIVSLNAVRAAGLPASPARLRADAAPPPAPARNANPEPAGTPA